MTEDEDQPDAEVRAIFAMVEKLCGYVPEDFRKELIERRLIWIANGRTWAPAKVLGETHGI
jgi:hypothetical protein